MLTSSMRLLFALFALCLSADVLAAKCGALNQRPCTVLERIPSCDANLIESGGRCITRPAAQPAPPISLPVKQRPANCGRHQQRPCNVAEFIPSCDGGLVEFRGQCMTSAETKARPGDCGRYQQRPCGVTEFIPSCEGGLVELRGQCRTVAESKERPGHCGRLQQAPCGLTEFFPSCEASLVENQGRCKTPAQLNCGSLNQRACNVLERIPPCNDSLVEVRGICHSKGACGAAGQRPCELGERVPSCNPNLKENFKRHVCEALRPGESPFLGGVVSLTEFYGDTITSVCQQGMGSIPIDTSTAIGVGAECTKNVFTGAACSYLADVLGAGMASSLGALADSPRQVEEAARQAKLFEVKVDRAHASGVCLGFAEKVAPASRAGPANGLQCGAGLFADPNGSCYSCPKGYTRTLEAVDSARACVDKPAGELLRSACAVFQAATQDMAKSAACTTEVLTSGVFVDQKMNFGGASREFCLATGELTHAITSIIVPGKSPEQKAQQISTRLGNFVQKLKSTKQRLDPALTALSNAKTVVDQSSNMGDKLNNLLSCK